jgi:hypothetical protein
MARGHSRYLGVRPFVGQGDSPPPFRGARPREIGTATGRIEHTVRAGDRLDALARHYYNDDRLWWRIVDANPEFLFGADMVLENSLVELDGLSFERRNPPEDALVVRESMIGRVIVIPGAHE